jgi:SAM-dependent methyltransferase
MKARDQVILAHHQMAAAMWGQGGKDYDEVSFAISDALAHAAQRLNARAGERILDIATGTGWSARNVARGGAVVTGADISPELLAAARDLSGHMRPPIEFHLADAEQLPFDDAAFDGVISTFGVIFAINQESSSSRARACVPLRRALGTFDLGSGGGRGRIFRGHCSPQRRTSSPLIAVGLG